MTISISGTSGGRRAIVLGGALACVVAAAPVAAAPPDWLGAGTVNGSGAVRTQTRAVAHFDALALSLPGTVELRLGDQESVTIETDGNLLPLIETVVENGTLKIRPEKRRAMLAPTVLKIVVQAKSVQRLSVGGSGSIRAAELRAPKLQFEVGGSGSIDIRQLRSEAVAVSIGGSGDFTAAGSTEQLTLAIGGSGNVAAGKLNARAVHASIGGSGQAVVWARQSLEASIAGSGGIDYYGDPQVSRSVLGSGQVKRLGAAPR